MGNRYIGKIRARGLRRSCAICVGKIIRIVGAWYEMLDVLFLKREMSDNKFWKAVDFGLSELKGLRKARDARAVREVGPYFVDYMKGRRTPRFFFDFGDRNRIVEIVERGSKEFTQERADAICKHDFRFIIRGAKFCGAIDWLSNLINGKRWPTKYWREIDYASEARIGDVRQIWELNRHQHFISLGKAYWCTGDERYAKEFTSEIGSWISQNPYGKSVNWVHAQEVGLRIMAWIWAYHFFCNSPSFAVQDQIEFLKALYLQTEFLRKHLSDTSYSTHNHIISEAAGLAMMAIMFPEFKKAKLWWKDGVERLERELKRQICDDGVSGETSTNYHFFVLDSFMQIWILLRKNGFQLRQETGERLEKMIELSMYVCRPDGTLPIIGDSDSGRAMRLDDLNGYDRRSYLSTGAVLFGREDMKGVAGKFYEESLWLLGSEGYRRFRELGSSVPRDLSRLYPDAGYCVVRGDWSERSDQLIFRGGGVNIPKDVAIGHNHADYLSFELIVDGIPFVVDPGVYTYNLDDGWRWYARRTSSHNTVVVDGRDQFIVDSQRFGLPKIARGTIHRVEARGEEVCIHISHDGYQLLDNPVIHHRKMCFHRKAKVWSLTDIFQGQGKHRFEWYFHFDIGIEVIIESGCLAWAKSKDGKKLLVKPQLAGNLSGEVVEGWISRKYGMKDRGSVLRYSLESDCPCEFQMELSAQE